MDGQTPDCISDYRLDKLMAGELDDDTASAARAHLAACESCTARAAALEADRAEFRAAPPPLPGLVAVPVAARAPRPRRHRLVRFAAPALALAAAAALFLIIRPGRPDDPTGVVTDPSRPKGGPSLGFYRSRDGRVTPGASGDALVPGDQVRFAVTTDRPGYLVVGSVDGAGRAAIYVPRGPRALAIEPGTDQLAGGSVELDDVLGTERVVAFFCDHPIDVAAARAALTRSAPALPGCRIDRLEWVKRAR